MDDTPSTYGPYIDSGAGPSPATTSPAPEASKPAPGEWAETTSTTPATAPTIAPERTNQTMNNLPSAPPQSFGAKVYHGILAALGGAHDTVISRDPQTGALIKTDHIAQPGEQWKRIISGALTGFAGAQAAGTQGPGGTMRGLAGGIQAGAQARQRNYDQARNEANEDFKTQQEQKLNSARNSLIAQQTAESSFRLDQMKRQADQADIDLLNLWEAQKGKPGTQDLGTFQTPADAFKFAAQYRQVHSDHADGRLFIAPNITAEGRKGGIRAMVVSPDWQDTWTTEDAKYPVEVPGPGPDGKGDTHYEYRTIPAGQIKQGELQTLIQNTFAVKNKKDIDDENLAVRQQLADVKQQLADLKAGGGNEPQSWQIAEDSNGKPILFNTKTGETKGANGVQRAGTHAKTAAGDVGEQQAINYANDYLENGVFTGSGDEALQEKFFELAKPKTGFRMSQPQMDMLRNSRSWMDSVKGQLYHTLHGTWFSPDQRKQIVSTMQELAKARAAAGPEPEPAAPGAPQIEQPAAPARPMPQGQTNLGGVQANVVGNMPNSAVKPPHAPPANLLKEGIHTTFKNGQTWTLVKGIPTQVTTQ